MGRREAKLNHLSVLPITAKAIAAEMLKDVEGRELIQKLRDGESLGADRDRLYSLQSGCAMQGLRTFIPEKFRKTILQELHSGHLGQVKMKALARNYVFWPRIDHNIEELCRNCEICTRHKGNPIEVETHYWEYPSKPWERLHLDFAFYGALTYEIIVDAHSKWPEIFIIHNVNSQTVIHICDDLFAMYGLPKCIVNDNQSSLVSRQWRDYLAERNIKLITSPPYHAASNGQAERMVGALKNCPRTSTISRIQKYLCI